MAVQFNLDLISEKIDKGGNMTAYRVNIFDKKNNFVLDGYKDLIKITDDQMKLENELRDFIIRSKKDISSNDLVFSFEQLVSWSGE